jgi:aspartate-semialdehyde dehydrogenase
MAQQQVCVVGGESLLGRELRDQLAETKFPASVKLVGADEEGAGIITVQGAEPVVMTALDEGVLAASRIAFLAGSEQLSHKVLAFASRTGSKCHLIDLSGGLEDQPNARLRAPSVESEPFVVEPGAIHVMAHPASVVLASLLGRIYRKHTLRHAVVIAFEPVSERGQPGLNELQQQTANLLSFRALPKDVFDAQISFNMLARYGESAPLKLEDIEHRIERHMATLFGQIPMPSLRLVQAPVFHGYSFSLWLEFENPTDCNELAEAMATAQIEVRSSDLEPPSNVGSVGQSGVTVGLIEPDRNLPRAIWMWAVADNFRITVDNALEVAKQLL